MEKASISLQHEETLSCSMFEEETLTEILRSIDSFIVNNSLYDEKITVILPNQEVVVWNSYIARQYFETSEMSDNEFVEALLNNKGKEQAIVTFKSAGETYSIGFTSDSFREIIGNISELIDDYYLFDFDTTVILPNANPFSWTHDLSSFYYNEQITKEEFINKCIEAK